MVILRKVQQFVYSLNVFIPTVAPRILKESFAANNQLKAGKSLVLDVKFMGEPMPVGSWTWTGKSTKVCTITKYLIWHKIQFALMHQLSILFLLCTFVSSTLLIYRKRKF